MAVALDYNLLRSLTPVLIDARELIVWQIVCQVPVAEAERSTFEKLLVTDNAETFDVLCKFFGRLEVKSQFHKAFHDAMQFAGRRDTFEPKRKRDNRLARRAKKRRVNESTVYVSGLSSLFDAVCTELPPSDARCDLKACHRMNFESENTKASMIVDLVMTMAFWDADKFFPCLDRAAALFCCDMGVKYELPHELRMFVFECRSFLVMENVRIRPVNTFFPVYYFKEDSTLDDADDSTSWGVIRPRSLSAGTLV